jgi:hypothetical protein
MARWPTFDQKRAIFQAVGYEPNAVQVPIHQSVATLVQIVGAEGAGKSRVLAEELIACSLWCKLIYLVGQKYENSQREFEYMVDSAFKIDLVKLADISQPQRAAWSMTCRNGCRVHTISADAGASGIIARGEEPDIIALCEAGRIGSSGVLSSAVRRVTRSNGRVILSGTLIDDFGWYASLVDELTPVPNAWRGATFSLPAWTNLMLYPGGRDDVEIRRLESILPSDEFARTVAAVRVPSRALVLPEFNYADHVRPCPFDPELPVTLWIDPGYFPSAYAVLAVQFHGRDVWHIDEVYLHQHTHDQVIDECKKRAWWGKVNGAVIDFAGRQHQADRSAAEVWSALAGVYPRSRPVGILDGISRHRTFLMGHDGHLYHDPCCVNTLREYKRYSRPTDSDGHPTSDLPVDRENHALKCVAYGLVDKFGFVLHPVRKPQPQKDAYEFAG